MQLSAGPVVGLDIGTSAVRAATVASGRGGYSLTSFAQVPLPSGAVAGGEVRDEGAVVEALSTLWKRGRMKSKRVVLGVANQRVVVRQVDLPYLEEKEFRGALKFQVADHIPMPVEDAELDYQIVDDFETQTGEHLMRVLLVAAATDMVNAFVSAASAAGLEPVGVDLTPFAVARAVSPLVRGEMGAQGAEAIIDVGAGITSVVVHVGGEPRFVRILLVGGDELTRSLASDLNVTPEEAEAVKMDLGRGLGSPEANRFLGSRVDALVEEIRGSIDYYSSQEEIDRVTSVIVTGGASLSAGLMNKLEQALRLPLQRGAPFSQISYGKSGLNQAQAAQVEPVVAASIGLAMGSER